MFFAINYSLTFYLIWYLKSKFLKSLKQYDLNFINKNIYATFHANRTKREDIKTS